MSKAKMKAASRDAHRRSHSRNSTPVSASSLSAIEPVHTPYLTTPLSASHLLSDTPVGDLFDVGSTASPPSASALRSIHDNVKSHLLSAIKPRGEVCERLMRELHGKKKERTERARRRELEQREVDERKKMATVIPNPKKRAREDETRPLAVGAHGVARQDGGPKGAPSSSSVSSPISQPPKTPTEAKQDPGTPMSDVEPHQPPAAPAIQQYQVFGADPTNYPDDTIYEILPITPGMTDDERRAIYCVAEFPESDLHDQTAGTPPDRDFSNAKPAQQINFSTFQNFAEPFLRPLTEEDRGFLLERGDRERPFVIPKLGAKHYREIWDEEDGKMVLDPNAGKLPANEARGSLEDMDDDVAETDQLSVGPTLARLLSSLRSEYQFRAKEDEVKLPGIDDHMEIDGELNGRSEEEPMKPISSFPELYWKGTPTTRPDHGAVDERIIRELQYLGLVAPLELPDYTSSEDDEIAARLRYLQNELRRVSIKNGARKQRLLELTEDWMSKLEYSNIADDLDNQINQAYLKRNRTVGKKKQNKKPGGPGGGSYAVGVARTTGAAVGINEPIRGLIERKTRWKEWIGPVVDYGKTSIPRASIFEENLMKTYEAKEQDTFGEVEE